MTTRRQAQRNRESRPSSPHRQKRPVLIAGGLLAILLAAALIGFNAFGGQGTTVVAGLPMSGTALGDANAPLVMEEFSDFQCPFCGQFARQTGPQILEQYVKTGKVRFVYRHLAFIGQESMWAAQAAECASDQGRFWEYHDKLFASQAGENRGTFSKDNLKRFARDLGLESSRFDGCLDSNQTLERVQRDTEEGQRRKIQSTPTFFVNDEMIQGALPFATFKTTFDRKLAQ